MYTRLAERASGTCIIFPECSLISPHFPSILITDARDTVNTTMRYYGLRGDTGAHLPLNYQLLQIAPGTTTGTEVREYVEEVVKALPGDATPDWLVSSPTPPLHALRNSNA
jgi:hypothetical protein